jgi:hypothetical protein
VGGAVVAGVGGGVAAGVGGGVAAGVGGALVIAVVVVVVIAALLLLVVAAGLLVVDGGGVATSAMSSGQYCRCDMSFESSIVSTRISQHTGERQIYPNRIVPVATVNKNSDHSPMYTHTHIISN